MQFESHLGHNRSPRQGGFCFNVCTKLAVASSDGLTCGLLPGRRAGLFRCVGGGSSALAEQPSACCLLGLCGSSLPVLSGRPLGLLTPIHGPGGRGLHDRWAFDTRLRCEVSVT